MKNCKDYIPIFDSYIEDWSLKEPVKIASFYSITLNFEYSKVVYVSFIDLITIELGSPVGAICSGKQEIDENAMFVIYTTMHMREELPCHLEEIGYNGEHHKYMIKFSVKLIDQNVDNVYESNFNIESKDSFSDVAKIDLS